MEGTDGEQGAGIEGYDAIFRSVFCLLQGFFEGRSDLKDVIRPRLQFDDHRDLLLDQIQDLLEGRDLLPVDQGVIPFEFLLGQAFDFPFFSRHPKQGKIMEDDELVVFGEMQIEFDRHPLLDGFLEGDQGILGDLFVVEPAMGDAPKE